MSVEMQGAATSRPPRRMSVRSAAAYRRRRAAGASACLLVALAALVTLALLRPDDRLLAAPMMAIALTATVYMMVLWVRDGSPPVFEAGTLCMLAITVYGMLPMAGFLMMHGRWGPFTDTRLHAYPFIPSELGAFGWQYALYAAAFAITYVPVRGRAVVKTPAFTLPNRTTETAIVIVLALLYAVKIILKFAYGYDPDDFSYSADRAETAGNSPVLPYVILQIAHNALSALFVVQLAVILLLLAHWRTRWWCRYALAIWLGAEVLSTVITLGARGRVVLLLISAGILYHRLVKRLGFRRLAGAGLLLLSGFLIHGAIRVAGSEEDMRARAGHFLVGANEFQGLFTTAFDLHKRKEAGELASVPWQVYVSDFYLPIPSQVLPFEKIDPSSWYIDVIGQTGAGIGYMFGVMSQAAVGLDWIELVLRGAVLAVMLALLHRWYSRRATHLWPTLFYLFVGIWVYYTFRASTFYPLYFVVYHFVPVLLATKLLEWLLRRLPGARLDRAPMQGA